MVIKNLKKAATRVLKAIKNKERIILYGDADLDGTASVIILKEAIRNLGGNVAAIYFPDREIEGYGITETGLNFLKKFTKALLISLDLGIGNFREIKLAKKLGFEIMVIDHHEILDGLPKAKIVVDPKQKGDRYPFKGLANAGIVFKLAELLLKKNMTENIRKNLLELVVLATIADMMPKEDDNKVFIEEGEPLLENSWRPGIRAFFALEDFQNYSTLEQKISKIISILNVRDVENNLPANFRLLTFSSFEESKELIEKLLKKRNSEKQKKDEIIQEIEARLSGKLSEKIIFEGDSYWDIASNSSIASTLCQRYKKPTFIFKKLKKESQGTVRTQAGINSVALMKKCKKLLLTYGGHPLASGFRIKNENLEKFKKCLIENLNKR